MPINLRQALRCNEVFSLDTRSLALFRIGLALLILYDYGIRLLDLQSHYSDSGVLPRTVLTADPQFSPALISLHLASGSTLFQGFMLLAGTLAACALLFGYRTWLATFISWFLLVSVQNRTPLMMQGDDVIRRMCLFWSLFLPLGAYYSLDKALSRYPVAPREPDQFPRTVLSWATAAFMAQLMMVYVFNALEKSDATWHHQGTALYYTLQLDHLVRPAGHALATQSWLLTLLSRTITPFELCAPLLLLIPVKNAHIRLAVIFVFIVFHTGIAVCMAISIFSATCIVYWLGLLPSQVWDSWEALARRRGWQSAFAFQAYFDADCGFCRRMVGIIREILGLPAALFAPSHDNPEIQGTMEAQNSWVLQERSGHLLFGFDAFLRILRASPLHFWLPKSLLVFVAALLKSTPVRWAGNNIYRWIANHRVLLGRYLAGLTPAPASFRLSSPGQALAALSLACVLLWNLRVLLIPKFGQGGQPHWYDRPAIALRLDQKWTMFAPYPMKNDGWYVIIGKRNDGRQVNLLHPVRSVSFAKPARLEASFGNYRWRQYLIGLALTKYARYRLQFARYLNYNWNRGKPRSEQLSRVDIYFVLEPTPPPGSGTKAFPVLLHSYNCASDSGKTLPSGINWEWPQIRAASQRMLPVK